MWFFGLGEVLFNMTEHQFVVVLLIYIEPTIFLLWFYSI